MSIDAKHPSPHEDMSDSEQPRCFPFEQFPLPPSDKSRDARVPNATASLDPPLMEFIYPPPPPLANDPSWYAQMVAEVHRNRAHVKTELELARTEAAEALADVTLAEIELQAEKDKMQDFLNRMAYVAGKNFVRKMIRKVHQSMMGGDENMDEEYEEELEREDYEDSRASDEGEVHHQYAEENFGGGNGEFDEGAQDAKDGTDGSRESPEPQPADESPNSSPQRISHQQTSPDWRRGDVADSDDEYSSGEDDTPRKWTDLSPVYYKSRKRPLEVEEEEETNNPEDSPRKKYKETPQSPPPKDNKYFPFPMRCFYPPPPPEKKQDNPIDQDNDSEEEYEVEKSLTLEDEPVLPSWPYLPQLNRLERDPYRVRQNSQGEPELYVPGRLAIEP